MRKVWIFMGILFLIVFGIAIACAVNDPFKVWFGESMIYVFGGVAVTINDVWAGIAANPIYQQWHMLIWFAGGVIGTVIFTKILLPRIPKLNPQKQATAQTYQHDIATSTPQSIAQPVPQEVAKPAAKKEESVSA